MTVYFHRDKMVQVHKPFFLYRYQGSFGEWYELTKNKKPRGKSYKRIAAIEWKANHKKWDKLSAKLLVQGDETKLDDLRLDTRLIEGSRG